MGWVWLVMLSAVPVPPVAPVPAWIDVVEIPTGAVPMEGAQRHLLLDVQLRVGATRERFEHVAWKVTSLAGIEELAKQEFVWEPTYEKLTLHGVWIWRNGERRVAWDKEDARVLQRESGLDQGLYDGRQTLIIELRDLRVGDIVETAATIAGENPVMQNHFTYARVPEWTDPLSRSHFKLIWERPRALIVRSFGDAPLPVSTVEGKSTVYRFDETDVKGRRFEDHVPADVPQAAWVTFTDWQDWGDVAKWSSTLFSLQPKGKRFATELARFKALPEEERVPAIVRFVQDDIRYVGVELGAHSHQPHSAEWVLERGFGDCKDKSLLLVSFLRGIGLEAWPVLVDTQQGLFLPKALPSSSLFDHAIVKVQLPRGARFIDATNTLRRGNIAQMRAPPFHWGLVVRPETTQLEEITDPPPRIATWEVAQTWTEKTDGKAILQIETIARDYEAAELRRRVLDTPSDKLSEERLRQREDLFDVKLAPLGLTWTDDEGAEVFTVKEKYEVPAFFVEGARNFRTLALHRDLQQLSDQDRKLPFSIRYPQVVKEVVVWNSKSTLVASNFKLVNKRITHPAFEFGVSESIAGEQLRVEWELRHKKDRVLPDEVPTYRKAVNDTYDAMEFPVVDGVTAPLEAPRPQSKGMSAEEAFIALTLVIVIGLLIVAVAKGPAWFRDQKARSRQKNFAALNRGAPGEMASHPITVHSLSAAEALFTSRSCPLGHSAWSSAEPTDSVRLGEERVTVLSRTCSQCDARESRYVKLPSA